MPLKYLGIRDLIFNYFSTLYKSTLVGGRLYI